MPSAIGMVLANLTYAETNGAVLFHLKVVRCAQRRGLILVSQRLFGKVVKLLILTFRLAGLLPKLVSAADDIPVGNFCHSLHLKGDPSGAG